MLVVQERQRALVGVAVIEDAARRGEAADVLQTMASHRGLADVQAAGASALAAIMLRLPRRARGETGDGGAVTA